MKVPMNSRTTRSRSLPRWGEVLDSYTLRFSNVLERRKYLLLALFCLVYGCLTAYRASMKLFWFDELFTVYLSRLPDLNALWSALAQGTDFNPPLFYALTRFSEFLFGEGNIGT